MHLSTTASQCTVFESPEEIEDDDDEDDWDTALQVFEVAQEPMVV